MLTPFADLLAARGDGVAVAAFSCYDLETAIAALQAATVARAGVIVLIGARSFTGAGGELLLAALVAAARRAPAAACVQLDHCDDLTVIEAALEGGAGAVMADGSALAYEQNVQFVAGAVELARAHGASVEAELGGIAGDEDVAEAVAAGALTDPAEALDFMGRTAADCLAVSIGNVHGSYREPPCLDWARLDGIRAKLGAPLSLHGASGIPDELIRRAIAAGIAKINVNSELRQAYLAATEGMIGSVLAGSRLNALHTRQVRAVEGVIAAKLRAFDTGGST
ncbi:MAG: class II fructose-bisphosphate aldolase [Actinomycetota bacterium]|nr:class II fructose-bisphosphate aldolase [Actinomycetota bacterium]